MAYLTSADLVTAVGRMLALQLTDPDNTGAIDETIFGEAAKSIEATINGYCEKRFKIPFTAPVPEVIRQLAIDGVIYKLKSRGKSMVTVEEIEAERNRIMLLNDIRLGNVALDMDPAPLKSSYVVDAVSPVMSAKKLARDARKGIW